MLWVLTLGWAVIYADRTSLYPLLAIIATLLAFGLFSNSAFTPVMVAWTGDLAGKRYPGSTGAAVGIYNCVIMTSAIIAPLVFRLSPRPDRLACASYRGWQRSNVDRNDATVPNTRNQLQKKEDC